MTIKTEVEKKENGKVLIKASLPFEKVEEKKEKAFKEIAKNIEVDGFRKGNVPEKILKEKIQESQILERAAQEVINESFPEIIEKEKIKMIGYPKITVTKLSKGNDFQFDIEVSVYPEVELPDYKKLLKEIKFEKKEFKDEDLKKLEENILAMVNQQRKKDGKDEKKELDEEVVKEISPFDSVEKFREQMKEDLKKEAEYEDLVKLRGQIGDLILENTKFDVPEILVDAEIDKIIAQTKDDILRHNLDWNEYLKTIAKKESDLREEYKADAEKRAKFEIILKEIFKKEGIQIDENKVKAQIEAIKQAHPDVNDENIKLYVENILINEEVMKFLESFIEKK